VAARKDVVRLLTSVWVGTIKTGQ